MGLESIQKNRFPTKEQLCKRGIISESKCSFWSDNVKNLVQCLYLCLVVVDIWNTGGTDFHNDISFTSIQDRWLYMLQLHDNLALIWKIIYCWQIWISRNERLLGKTATSPLEVINSCQSYIQNLLNHTHSTRMQTRADNRVELDPFIERVRLYYPNPTW